MARLPGKVARPSWNALNKAYLDSYKGAHKIPKSREEVIKAGSVPGFLSTGCRRLDLTLGQGVPRSKIIYIHGPTSQGKTAMAVDIGIQAQNTFINDEPGTVVYYDLEGGYDPLYAERRGMIIDPKTGLFLMPPVDTAEQVFEESEKLLDLLKRSNNPMRILYFVVDSIASTSTDAEQADKNKWHRKNTGHQAAVLSLCMRNFRPLLRGTNCVFLMINQDRDKIDMYSGRGGVSNPGGKSLKYYSSQVLEVCGPQWLYRTATEGKVGKRDPLHKPIGLKMRVYVEKNRTAEPFRTATFPFYFQGGVDDDEATLWFFDDHSLVQKGKKVWTVFAGKEEYEFAGVAGFKKLLADKKIKKVIHEAMAAEAGRHPDKSDHEQEVKRILADKDDLDDAAPEDGEEDDDRPKPKRKVVARTDDEDEKDEQPKRKSVPVKSWGSGRKTDESDEVHEE